MRPLANPKKLLLIKLRALGDTVLMTAPLQELHRQLPGIEIHVAIRSPWASLLENQPGVTKTWSYDRVPSKTARARSLARLAFQLRNEGFDWVINFHASPSSSLLALATGAPVRAIHFHGHRDKNRFSTVDIRGKGVLKPIIERDMDTVRALGFQIDSGLLPKLDFGSFNVKSSEFHIENGELKSPLLIIGLGASRPAKSWPVENFAKVAVAWARETNGKVIAAVAPNEWAVAEYFTQAVDRELQQVHGSPAPQVAVRSQIGVQSGMSVRELAALISRASVFLGNDSGPKHLAVACNVPTVTCFGPEDPFEWHPYPQTKHPYFFVKNLSCRKDGLPGYPAWCGLDVCVLEEHKCMKQIPVTEVLAACLKVKR